MDFESFLTQQESDYKNRTLDEIWKYSDLQIENTHDFIQFVFPLNKRSRSVFHGLYLDNEAIIQTIKNNSLAQANIIKSSQWFFAFLQRNNQWKTYQDHNQLRITRIIECLRLLVSDEAADSFYKEVLALVGNNTKINKITLNFWKQA